AVITAHTGLPTAKLFTDLTKVKKGDKFYVHNIKETLAYQVDQIKVVEPT
ncbi:sortase, partial [Streptococcus canis]